MLALALSGIVLFALGIRTGVAAIAPLAGQIELDVALVGVPLGALGTIPPIAYAIAASVSPWLARRIGVEWVAIAMALVGALAHVWRGVSPTYLSLFVATVVVMLAAGVANVVLPSLVKQYAPRAIGPMTAAYATAMALSSSAPTVVGLWVAHEWGWRVSLASWAIVSVLGAIPWIFVLPFARVRGAAEAQASIDSGPPRPPLRLWSSPSAVSIMLVFSVAGVSAYTWFGLLPVILVDISGLSQASAALALGLFAILGLPLSLVVPQLAVRPGWPPYLVAAAAVFGLVGIAGLLFAPGWMPFVWVGFLGLAPMGFHLSLTLIGKLTRDYRGALEVSGFVNTMGYLFAALAPVLVGLAFELTGGWTWALVGIGVVMAGQIPLIGILAKEAIVEDELRVDA